MKQKVTILVFYQITTLDQTVPTGKAAFQKLVIISGLGTTVNSLKL
jgi:hypothetical protein